MTRLSKPVTRWVDFGRGPVAVTLDPSGLIAFREKGRRTVYTMPLGAVFVHTGLAIDWREFHRRKREGGTK